jgi:hypothetical protein
MTVSHEPSGWLPRSGRATLRAVGAGCRKRVSKTPGRIGSPGPVAWVSRDPESAAQESLKRSVENAVSRPAMEYYFGQDPPVELALPSH